MLRPSRFAQLMAAAAFITVATAGITQAAPIHHPSAGNCGESKYWHDGHCVDARTKPGKDWTANVYL